VIADAQCVGHDRERWIHRAARWKETRINNVEIVELVCFAIAIECRRFWIVAKTHGAVLVRDCREWQSLAQVKISRKQALVTLMPVNVTVRLLHRFLQLGLQAIVTFNVV
jgi:hypothetical protein